MAASIEAVAIRLKIDLKKKQLDILQCLIAKKDCVAVLPTGFGKSLPYQLFPPIQKELATDEKVLVCCPLVSLMPDQTARANKIPGVTATYIGSTGAEALNDADIIFGTPESLIGDKDRREKIRGLNVSLIVVDEFHTIASWGRMGIEEDAFRKLFRHEGELRSLCPNATLLALSAAYTIWKTVINVLGIDKAFTKFVVLSPNTINIKFVVQKVPYCVETVFFWLMEAIDNLKKKFPRTLIYCNSL